MHINFITTQSLTSISGGWSGMNVNIFNQLNKYFEVTYIGPINPKTNISEKLTSKFFRTFGLKGKFFFFSPKRLSIIAEILASKMNNHADALFFHGSTPWINFAPTKPYFAYLDASFHTFLSVYSKPTDFNKKDIDRILKLERVFLQNARRIFFSSKWALEETKSNYHLNGDNFTIAGLGGHMAIPTELNLASSCSLLFISVDFVKKGGITVIETFEILKKQIPNLILNIVGQKPPESVLKKEGIVYHGFLHKNIPDEVSKLEELFSTALFLLHPTQKDMTPLVIVEAGYYGIPAIAPSMFGIPEMIEDNETGFLIDKIESVYIANKIMVSLQNNEYPNLRKKTREHFIHDFTWEKVGEKIALGINKSVSE
jgi:glycosyltransferase involved in cell wall biosynthesis